MSGGFLKLLLKTKTPLNISELGHGLYSTAEGFVLVDVNVCAPFFADDIVLLSFDIFDYSAENISRGSFLRLRIMKSRCRSKNGHKIGREESWKVAAAARGAA